MSSNGTGLVTRTFTCNNSTLNCRVGFKPKKVIITNTTSLASLEWDSSMQPGYAWKQVAAGTRTQITSGGPTAIDWSSNDPPGFSIGAVADINDTTTEEIQVQAWRE